MRKPLLILTVAAIASPALDAKTYSCGDGCYTDNSRLGKGRTAKLGNQIGYYSSVRPSVPQAKSNQSDTKLAGDVEIVVNEVSERKSLPKPRPVQVSRRSSAPVVPNPNVGVRNNTNNSNSNVAMATPAVSRSNPTKMSGRRTILEEELNNERVALAQAQKELAEGRLVAQGKTADAQHQNRVRQLESVVLDRQQNIQSIQRELNRMN